MGLMRRIRLVVGFQTILALRKIAGSLLMRILRARVGRGGGIARQNVLAPIALVPFEPAMARHAAQPYKTLAVTSRAQLVFGPA